MTDNAILAEVRAARQDIAVLNTKLFGEPSGDQNDGGRLVVAEQHIIQHAKRISRIEKALYGAYGVCAFIAFILEIYRSTLHK